MQYDPPTGRHQKKTLDRMLLRVYLVGDFLWIRKDKLLAHIQKI
jgi:hypothetical protein